MSETPFDPQDPYQATPPAPVPPPPPVPSIVPAAPSPSFEPPAPPPPQAFVPPPPPPQALPPAGWYPDPQGSGGTRYWDGAAWTATVLPPPPPGAVPPPQYGAPSAASYGQQSGPWTGQRTGVGPIEAVRLGLTRCLDYRGRSSRSEYWWFFLFSFLVAFVVAFIVAVAFPGVRNPVTGVVQASSVSTGFQVVLQVAGIFFGLPLFIRRLHDSGKSWLHILFGLIPFAGGIILIVFACTKTEPAVNAWGPPPK